MSTAEQPNWQRLASLIRARMNPIYKMAHDIIDAERQKAGDSLTDLDKSMVIAELFCHLNPQHHEPNSLLDQWHTKDPEHILVEYSEIIDQLILEYSNN